MDHRSISELHAFEETYWWHVGRRAIVAGTIERAFRGRRDLRILDLGCGSGGTLPLLARYGTVSGCDPSAIAVAESRARGVGEIRAMEGNRVPFPDGSFDLVTLLDVLEHVDDEAALLNEVHRVLVPGGALVLTVPAHPWLWSGHDVALEHRRRYTRSALSRVLGATLTVERLTPAIALVAPLIVGYRALQRLLPGRPPATSYIRLPRPLNSLLIAVLRVEAHLLRFSNLPFGITYLAVARTSGTEVVH